MFGLKEKLTDHLNQVKEVADFVHSSWPINLSADFTDELEEIRKRQRHELTSESHEVRLTSRQKAVLAIAAIGLLAMFVNKARTDSSTRVSSIVNPPVAEAAELSDESTCYDTDATPEFRLGNNPFQKGTIFGIDGEPVARTDKCEPGNKVVVEYHFPDESSCEVVWDKVHCPDFGPGWECKDGACVPPQEPPREHKVFAPLVVKKTGCYDTDGGCKLEVKGTATDSQGRSLTDECGDPPSLIYEAEIVFAGDGECYAIRTGYLCPDNTHCQEGACVEETTP